MKTLQCFVALGLLMVSSSLAQAQLQFTLSDPFQTAGAGDTLTFAGTLVNQAPAPLFLNADTFTLDGVGLALDDLPFLVLAPPVLAGGETYSGVLFDVFVGADAPAQNALGRFTVLGGFSDLDLDTLATQEFGISVVPEPGSLAYVAGVLALGAVCRRRRHRRQARAA